MKDKIFYKGFCIEFFNYDNKLSWRVLKAMNSINIEVLIYNYRTSMNKEEATIYCKGYIDALLNTDVQEDYYDSTPLY